jgi:hypothetical protein
MHAIAQAWKSSAVLTSLVNQPPICTPVFMQNGGLIERRVGFVIERLAAAEADPLHAARQRSFRRGRQEYKFDAGDFEPKIVVGGMIHVGRLGGDGMEGLERSSMVQLLTIFSSLSPCAIADDAKLPAAATAATAPSPLRGGISSSRFPF